MTLTGKQRRHLRALAHPLTAIVTVGKEGLTEAVGAAVDAALSDHELVKIRLGTNALLERKQAAAALAEATGSEVAQILGNTVVLYRADPEDPKIVLPEPATEPG